MATREEIEQKMMEEMEDLQLDEAQDGQDETMMNQQEFQESYGTPEPEQQFNQHAFLFNSLSQDSPEKVTYLDYSELGRPLFNVRFLLDIEDICGYYLDEMCKEYNITNKIAKYFREKINNIAASGMSNKGFVQNLNVTRKMDMTRKRIKNLNNQKGGSVQQQ